MFAQNLRGLLGSLVEQTHLIQPKSFIIKSHTLPSASTSYQIRGQITTTTTSKPPRAIRIKRRTLNIKPTPLDKKYKMEWPKVTLFGDSITRRSFDVDNGCWGSMIAFKLGDYFDVDFRGFEGYNSKWALEMMPNLFPKTYLDKVEIFIPFFGHNDSLSPLPQSTPVDQFEQNMRSIIKYLLDNGLSKEKIILMTPSWYYSEAFIDLCKELQFPSVTKSLEHSKLYSDVILSIAKDNDISVLDFFNITAKYQPLGDLFCDGIHFSQKGARLLFDNLMPIIEKKVEAKFKKPLGDLHFATPFDQIPEVAKFLGEFRIESTD